MSKLTTVDAGEQASVMQAALRENGAVIVRNFLDSSVLEALNRELDAIAAAEQSVQRGFANDAVAEFFGDHVDHIAGLAGKSAVFVQNVLCHPLYMATCEHFLRPLCADYQLNLAHVMSRCPGSEPQILHRDAWVWKRMPADAGEVQLASMIALNDFTAANGATMVVPGSHKWTDERYPDISEAVPAEMPAGSAVIYLGNTYHGGGGNSTTGAVRRGLHVSYTLGWLRTEENQCLAAPWYKAQHFGQRAQQLLGWGVHDDLELGGGYLGTLEMEQPMEWLGKTQTSG